MTNYQQLSTEKLYFNVLKDEASAIRREKNRSAVRSLFHFVLACGMILFTLFAIESMPVWLPKVTAYLGHELQQVNGLLESQGVTK